MNQIKEFWYDLYKNYIEIPERDEHHLQQFHEELTQTSILLYRISILFAFTLVLVTRVGDYVYIEEPYLSAAMTWRIWLVVIVVSFVAISYSRLMSKSFSTIFAFHYLIVCIMSGYYFSFIGREHPVWIGVLTGLPFFLIPLPCGFFKRFIINILSLSSFTGFIYERGIDIDVLMSMTGIMSGSVIGSLLIGHLSFYRLNYLNYFNEKELEKEKKRSEELLVNILPESIAERLPENNDLIADGYESASVLFADLVEFTPMADELPPDMVVMLLDDIFSTFDQEIREYPVEKIKTVGDEYFVVSGLPERRDDHAVIISRVALKFRETIEKYKDQADQSFDLRIGINSGPVVAGVIGTDKFVYDVWGDTVNVGSRMESKGKPGEIHVTPDTKRAIEEQDDSGRFKFEERGAIDVKGKGKMITYFLKTSTD